MQVSVHTAEANLSRLIEAAQAGEEVIIAEGEKPLAQIIAFPKMQRFIIGSMKEQLAGGKVPDFFEPMSEEDLALWEGRGKGPE